MSVSIVKPLAVIALGAIALTGCSSTGRDSIQVGAVPDDYRTRHPIVISQKEQTLDVAVASGVSKLDMPTQSNIEAFSASFAGGGGGVIHILEPAGSANTNAVMAIREQVIAAIMRGGVSRDQIAIQTYDATAHGVTAPIRLSYQAVAASVGQCGKWFEEMTNTPENKNYHDFGCSTQSNLATMISNPNDLMGPRASSPIDAQQRAQVMSTYQAGPQAIASEVTY